MSIFFRIFKILTPQYIIIFDKIKIKNLELQKNHIPRLHT
jgi:hypothetical protein